MSWPRIALVLEATWQRNAMIYVATRTRCVNGARTMIPADGGLIQRAGT